MLFCAFSNAVSQQAAKDLCKAVEAEPYPNACSLLFLRIPLACEECKARCDGRFEDAKEETHGDCTGIVLYGGHAAKNKAPHYYAKGGIFGEGETLKEAVSWVFPGQITWSLLDSS